MTDATDAQTDGPAGPTNATARPTETAERAVDGADGSTDTGDAVGDRPSRRRILASAGAIGTALVAGCLGGDGDAGADGDEDGGADRTTEPDTEAPMTEGGMDSSGTSGDELSSLPAWQTTELSTVRGEESFSVAGLDGPVVIQSFAVWCPKCQRQSEQLADLDDSITVVGLNIDPNEDAEKVRNHAESNGFDWRFAVAPTAMTDSLVDEFGTTVTNAPSTPVITACESGEATFMSGSVNTAGEITAAADDC